MQYLLTDNMIGGQFPFFMTNTNLGDSGYVYQIQTPSYNKTSLRPYIILTKVCNRTFSEKGEKILSRDNDVLFAVLDDQYKDTFKNESGEIDRSKINWVGQVKRLIDSKGTRVIPNIIRDGFPLIEITGTDLLIQNNLILNLRNSFRWKRYKLAPGNEIDILTGRDKFTVFKIVDGGEVFKLLPIGAYRNTDIALTDNLLVVDEKVEPLEMDFSKKVPEFMGQLKDLEFRMFQSK